MLEKYFTGVIKNKRSCECVKQLVAISMDFPCANISGQRDMVLYSFLEDGSFQCSSLLTALRKRRSVVCAANFNSDCLATLDSPSVWRNAVGVLLLGLAVCVRSCCCNLTLQDILPDDPAQYDKSSPPKKEGRPTVVLFHVTVMSLDSIDEESMTYAADIFFSQSWKDHLLRLPENMTADYRVLQTDWLERVWRPDCVFKNAKQVTFQTMTVPNHYIWLYRDKTILYMVKLTLTLSCAMNFASYPHDTQTCSMQMESLSHTTDDLVFEWNDRDPPVVHTDFELPQLDLEQTDPQDCTESYSTGNFTCLQLTFRLKRRLGYYMFHTYIPTCLIVIMSWISFWIKPEAVPARVTLGVTSLLTLCTQHAKSQADLPPVSYIKAIDIFMSSCTVFVFASLMEYAVVNIILEDGYKQLDVVRAQLEPGSPSQPNPRDHGRLRALLIDKVSRVVFPTSFVLLNAFYWIFYVLCA